MSRHERMQSMYDEGSVPWDSPEPPPEVSELAGKLPVGRALDLGTGLGRAAIYLAKRGWLVDGVDFVAKAVEEARTRAQEAGVAQSIRFHHSPVTNLAFLTDAYDFALDVGCAHGFSDLELEQYHCELKRLLVPGAYYLLFAHLNEENAEEDQQNWLDESKLKSIFADGFTLEKEEYGQTEVRGQEPWRSAWFWFRKD